MESFRTHFHCFLPTPPPTSYFTPNFIQSDLKTSEAAEPQDSPAPTMASASRSSGPSGQAAVEGPLRCANVEPDMKHGTSRF